MAQIRSAVNRSTILATSAPALALRDRLQGDTTMNIRLSVLSFLFAAAAGPAMAQQFVYPAKGQSPEQQKTDEAECYTWAVGQTGFDPAKPPQAAAPAPAPAAAPAPSGGRVRGAAAAATVAAITDNDVGDAAVAGAVAGGAAQRGQKRQQQRAAQQQQAAQQQAATTQASNQSAAFNKARAACLEGRGYTVK
ncbi:hypothetical protein [Niveibacterium umoris]|uniref:YMGG-like Gly-zipper domain-containing protein n=1 Tax=Niveibacterium umoris TaxID=1193620 RepID=A0A840BNM2_9RHOO|nr:hypothetical protein [Niveibacterium umoris]MBB4014184.1 hypothetical protein [Niveibacterium umoris]